MARTILTLLILTIFISTAGAVAPHPDAVEKWKAEGVWEEKIQQHIKMKELGVCAPSENPPWNADRRSRSLAAQAGPDTIAVPVILVDFSDNEWSAGTSTTVAMFDSLLFSDSSQGGVINPTGSMTDYYMQTSYGQMYVTGDVYGVYRAPKTYAYYVGTDYGQTRTAELVAAMVDMADPDILYSDYATAGYVNGVVLVHAGRGGEEGGEDIWSHKWSISPVSKDGVVIDEYMTCPEETGSTHSMINIGVFCHEFGHILGLPDFYDVTNVDGSSAGLGFWSLMATGNYLGGSQRPAHLDAWSKMALGLVDVIDVTQNLHQAEIPAAEWNPVVYRLKNSFTEDNQYFLVENRQKVGFDLALPNAGLCIYHFDNTFSYGGGNNGSPPYRLALEQADGDEALEYSQYNNGDAGDTWPGSTGNRNFHEQSSPSSLTNFATTSRVGVWNISNSDSIMYADLDVEYSRPWVVPAPLTGQSAFRLDDSFGGDGDGVPEAGETVRVYARVNNLMRISYNARASLAATSSAVTVTVPEVSFDQNLVLSPIENVIPLEFVVADTLTASLDSFYITITTDSLSGTPGSNEFQKTFVFEQQIGGTQVLVVDDDRGANYQQRVVDALLSLRIPVRVWDKQASGSPDSTDLMGYNIVLWNTGNHAVGSVFTSADVAAMKGYLNNGGNFMLSSISGIDDLVALDSAFVADYFKADIAGSEFYFIAEGIEGSSIGDGTRFFLDALVGTSPITYLSIRSGGEAIYSNFQDSTQFWGVAANAGNYKSVLLTFPADLINDGVTTADSTDTLINRVLAYFGGQATSVYDGSPFTTLPKSFTLQQNYPNPFNPTTTIQYTLRGTKEIGDKTPRTRLVIYNSLGQEVTTLLDKIQTPGTYSVEWNGTDDNGSQVASGVYFYRLERGDQASSMKMVLLK